MLTDTKVKLVNWFLNFLNMDLEKLSDDEKLMITADAINVVYGMGSYVVGGQSRPDMPADRWEDQVPVSEVLDVWEKEKQLDLCQQHLRRFFKKFIRNIESAKEYAEKWKPEFKNYFCFEQKRLIIKVKVETPLIRFEEPQIINKGEKNEQVLFRLNEDSLLNTHIQVAYRAETDEDTLLLYFWHALEGFPFGAWHQCPECERYFLHLYKKYKKYCSNPCAARNIGREKRKKMKKKDPDTYSQYLADEADRKRREYVGKAPKGSKPDRRPWRHKDSKEK